MWPRHPQPLVILAPMDGYTDPPFRRFIKRVAPRSIVFSEFLSAKTVRQKPSLAKDWFKIYPDEEPVIIQLYGKDAHDFKVAGKLAEDQGAAGVDINMGCPAKKVVAHQHGSALMKEIDLSCEIIAQLKQAINVPVTVKTRLGWEHHHDLIPFAKRLQDAGLDGITIHGRTYEQKFNGTADWGPIYDLKEALDIPVFGNGDIATVEDASSKLNNLDGVMIGRGAVADPWLLSRVCSLFYDEKPDIRQRSFQEKAPFWLTFAEMTVSNGTDEFRACCTLRKYLARLVKELGLPIEFRRKATSVSSLKEIEAVLQLFGSHAA